MLIIIRPLPYLRRRSQFELYGQPLSWRGSRVKVIERVGSLVAVPNGVSAISQWPGLLRARSSSMVTACCELEEGGRLRGGQGYYLDCRRWHLWWGLGGNVPATTWIVLARQGSLVGRRSLAHLLAPTLGFQVPGGTHHPHGISTTYKAHICFLYAPFLIVHDGR